MKTNKVKFVNLNVDSLDIFGAANWKEAAPDVAEVNEFLKTLVVVTPNGKTRGLDLKACCKRTKGTEEDLEILKDKILAIKARKRDPWSKAFLAAYKARFE
jgi:hypothetical protein